MTDLAKNLSLLTDAVFHANDSVASTLSPLDVVIERPQWKDTLEKWTSVIITCNLIFLMVGMGSATNISEILSNIKRPWGSVIGMFSQFGILPGVGMLLALYFQLEPVEAMALLIISCSPGGAFSNFFAYWLNGTIALSLLMTSTSCVLAFGGMPLNIWIYSRFWDTDKISIPYANILFSMAFATGPSLIGLLIRSYSIVWAKRITQLCSALGWIGALTSGTFILLFNWESVIETSLNIVIVSSALPACGFLIGFFISKLCCFDDSTSRTIGIETGCQNVVVAMNVIMNSYDSENLRRAIVLPLMFAVSQVVEAFIFIIIFQSYKFVHRNDAKKETKESKGETSAMLNDDTAPMENDIQKINRPSLTEFDVIPPDKYWIDGIDPESGLRRLSIQRKASLPIRVEDKYSRRYTIIPESENFLICPDEDYAQLLYNISGKRNKRNFSCTNAEEYTNLFSNTHKQKYPFPEVAEESIFNENEVPENDTQTLPVSSLTHKRISIVSSPDTGKVKAVADQCPEKTKKDEGKKLESPPRSPSLNSGYGFPTFRSKEWQ